MIYNLRLSRYILRGNSFPGIAGTYTSSKSHSRGSVIISVYRHIGTGLSVHVHFCCLLSFSSLVDAPNFHESPFWKDTDLLSGLGGWGDPNADFSIVDGGFSGLHLSYPSPHIIRRNFTLLPFDDHRLVFFTHPLKKANTSFSAAVIDTILKTSTGDYKGFQTALGEFEVRPYTEVFFQCVSSF